jgi:hypothetical protein
MLESISPLALNELNLISARDTPRGRPNPLAGLLDANQLAPPEGWHPCCKQMNMNVSQRHPDTKVWPIPSSNCFASILVA